MQKFPLFLLLSLIIGFNIQAQDQIIKSGDTWLYYEGETLDNNWFSNSNSNAVWKNGITPIGYGDRKITTHISFGSDEENKHVVKYFKKRITLKNPSTYLAYGFQFKRDDGIVIYLNGEEVFRNNLPIGTITNKTFAVDKIDGDAESEVLFTVIDTEEFKKGENTIAVSIHQSSKRSSDCIFDFEMFGYKSPKILSRILNSKLQKNNTLETEIKDLSQSMSLQESSLKLQLQEARAENLSFILIIIGSLLILAIVAVIILLLSTKKEIKILIMRSKF